MKVITQLKQILLKYKTEISINEDGSYKIKITDISHNLIIEEKIFESKNFTTAINEAHKHFKNQIE